MSDDPDPRVVLRRAEQRAERAIARAVVDEEYLPIARAVLPHAPESVEERRQAGLLVVTGNDQGDGGDVCGDHVATVGGVRTDREGGTMRSRRSARARP